MNRISPHPPSVTQEYPDLHKSSSTDRAFCLLQQQREALRQAVEGSVVAAAAVAVEASPPVAEVVAPKFEKSVNSIESNALHSPDEGFFRDDNDADADVPAGHKCVKKVVMVEEIAFDELITCEHVKMRSCFESFTTKFKNAKVSPPLPADFT